MTDFVDALLAVLLGVVINFGVLYQVRRSFPQAERAFLVRTYGATLLLRFLLAVVLNVGSTDSAFEMAFWGDSATYDYAGRRLVLMWNGEAVSSLGVATGVSGWGWAYVVGAIYWIIGSNQMFVQVINVTVGSVTVLIVYAIARHLFDVAVARWAAIFMAFFPQTIFWSAGMYKDPAILLCIACCMYAVIRLREQLSFPLILLFVSSQLALMTLRFYIAYFVGLAAFATFVLMKRRSVIRTAATFSLLALAVFGAITFALRRETLENQMSYMTLERLQTTREDQAMWGRSGFGQEYDVSTPVGALATLPIGLVYLLFAPFPWAVSGLRQALVMPETLVWYGLMPAFIRGLSFGLKRHFRAIIPILVFAVSLTLAYALMQGNIGTAYRQRTQVTMFFFIFMAAGIVEKRRRRLPVAYPIVPAVLPRPQ
jgi:4-amino-4-deoxy-L-arabinose transferase-like glycosyltransferase